MIAWTHCPDAAAAPGPPRPRPVFPHRAGLFSSPEERASCARLERWLHARGSLASPSADARVNLRASVAWIAQRNPGPTGPKAKLLPDFTEPVIGLAFARPVGSIRATNTHPHSRDTMRPRFAISSVPPKLRGRREDRVRAAPAVSCAMCITRNAHTSIQVQRKHSGLPCAMALQLISCSPRRPGFVATIARVMLSHHRQLDASTGASGPHDFAVRTTSLRLAHDASIAPRAQRP